MAPPASFIPLRLSLFYAAFFCVAGVMIPFWPLWLSSRGLSAPEIGVLMGIAGSVKVLTTPLAAHVADRTGERRRPVVALALLSLLAFAAFQPAHGFWPLFWVSLAFFGFWPPVMSLTESLTMMAAERHRFAYGRVRLWGSLSFIVVAMVAGRVLETAPPSAIFWIVLAFVALTLAGCASLPDLRATASRTRRLPFIETLAEPRFRLLLVACGLIQSSHAVYYAFGTIHWQRAGYSEALIGALWAEGVIAEILLFAVGGRVLATLGPARLLTLAGLACGVRWLGTGLSTDLPVLVALQLLHAFSFGAAHLAAMHAIATEVPPARSATAQSLYSGVVWGLFLGPMLFAAGWLYEAFAGGAYLAMAVVGLGGWAAARRLAQRRSGQEVSPSAS